MPDDKPATETLSYATPTAMVRIRYTMFAVASIVLAFLSALFAELTTFREGLTNAETHDQILTGRVGGTVGGVLAVALALVSYRRRASNHALSHIAITLSVLVFYIVVKLPAW